MRSFIFAVFASLAFSIFCSATPTLVAHRRLSSNEATKRDSTPPSVDSGSLNTVLTSFVTAIGPISDTMAQLEKNNADASDFSSHLSQIESLLLDAAKNLDGISGVSVDAIMENTAAGVPMDKAAVIQLFSAFFTVLILPVELALTFVPMGQLVAFAFQMLEILKPFFMVAIPAIYAVIGISGVLSVAQNVAIGFIGHVLR